MSADLREYATHARTVALRRKVELARQEIEREIAGGRFVVCSSWGKDSCALVSLVQSVAGTGFDVAHLESPYELPGYDRVLEWFRARCVVHTIPAQRTLAEYVEWLQRHGLGYERDKLLDARKASKRDELTEWIRDRGFVLQLLGMRAQESKGRRQCFRFRGLSYDAHGLRVSNPIGWWTARDVWSYLVSRDVPWHPLYDAETHGETRETLRNGGWLSVHGCNDARVPWLRAHYPEEYRALRGAFPQVTRLG
jgi:phosphoadenosine phosphosulfate reductase